MTPSPGRPRDGVPPVSRRAGAAVAGGASLAAALALVACGGSRLAPTSLGRWDSRAPLSAARQEMPSALLGGRIYTPGGLDAEGAASTAVEVYDVAADRWSSGRPLPEARHHPGVAAADGRVFVVGGYGGGQFPGPLADDVFALDPATGAWSIRRPMPAPRAAHVAVELGGKVYVIGGVRGGAVVGTNEVYDPATDSWRSLAPMPTPREHLAAAVVGDRIYVVGGRAPGNLATLEAYTPATDMWERLADMPTARGGLAAASAGGKVYAFGGESPGVFANTEEYDPAGNSWRRVADMPTPRHGMGAVTVGSVIYVIGGGFREGFGASAANESFTAP